MSFISRISNTAALLLRAAQTTDDVEEADAPTLPPRNTVDNASGSCDVDNRADIAAAIVHVA